MAAERVALRIGAAVIEKDIAAGVAGVMVQEQTPGGYRIAAFGETGRRDEHGRRVFQLLGVREIEAPHGGADRESHALCG